MKINYIQRQTFAAKQLYTAQLKNKLITGVERDIEAIVSELNSSDAKFFANRNSRLEGTTYGSDIIADFIAESKKSLPAIGKDKRYIVVKNPEFPDTDQYVGIASANIATGNMFIEKMQSINNGEMPIGLKGVGNSLMYAFIKMAQENKLNTISLSAINEKTAQFYRKLKFYPTELFGLNYSLHKSRFEDVAKELETRYLIKTKDTI